ncbi:Hypothetical protein (Fragment) [Durusdinium trenchii]|uniref:Uncharacterized protein n=1 Tax=Durusdinium trenchii TaxID=1381693 RepID=A0ABP0RAB0_9DINO
MAATSSGALRALSREERYAGGVSDLMNCLDEQLRPEPRLCWDFETLQAHLQQQRRRQAERVLARRLESLRAVSQAQASLGRFLDRRTSSVQEASCAASDAQGRLNRLQEQSQTVRVSALKRAQASLADAEQRALQEARARHLLLDQREQELATLLKLSGSLRSKSKATAENLTRMRETLEAAQRQASDVLEEKSYMEERRVQIEAREASLPVMERAWKEVVAQVGRDPKKRPALLAMAIEHISNELLKDQRYISCFTALEQKVSSDDRRGENPPLRRVVREAASERRRTPRRSTPCQEVPAPVSAASETLEDDLEVELEVEVDSPADVDGDGEVIWTPRESVTAVPGSVVGSAALERMGASKTQEEDQATSTEPEMKKVVTRSITAPPRRLHRWPPSSASGRVLVQTIPSARLEASPVRQAVRQCSQPSTLLGSNTSQPSEALRFVSAASPPAAPRSLEPPSTPQMPPRPHWLEIRAGELLGEPSWDCKHHLETRAEDHGEGVDSQMFYVGISCRPHKNAGSAKECSGASSCLFARVSKAFRYLTDPGSAAPVRLVFEI